MQLSFISTNKLEDLLRSASKQGLDYVQVHSKSQLAVGADPLHPTHVIDFTKEMVGPVSGPAKQVDVKEKPLRPYQRISRRTGQYVLEIKGQTIECASLKEVLSKGLLAMEKHLNGTLDRLSTVKPRSKRIVSRNRNHLFTDPALVDKYAEKLAEGWWYGTNNSKDETITWLRRGANISELKWGSDIKVHFG